MRVRDMIPTHPDVQGRSAERLLACIEECYSCAQACTACADACLAEPQVENLRQCIRVTLDCADLCAAAGAVASRRTGSNQAVIRIALEACEAACRLCAKECEVHAAEHAHCRICAEACIACAEACHAARDDLDLPGNTAGAGPARHEERPR